MFNDYPRPLLSANRFTVSFLKFIYIKLQYQSIQMRDTNCFNKTIFKSII
jgi:hypothetical protein